VEKFIELPFPGIMGSEYIGKTGKLCVSPIIPRLHHLRRMASLAKPRVAKALANNVELTSKNAPGRWTQEEKDSHHEKLAQDKLASVKADQIAREQAMHLTTIRPVTGPPATIFRDDMGPSSRASKDGFELSVAPMMAWTNRHYRYLARLLSKRTLLYTEMICTATILHRQEDLDNFLGYDEIEHPIAIQLGGADPEEMKKAAIIAEKWGYDEIDINVGCPSDKVAGAGCFGASLMLDHGQRVAEVVKTVLPAVTVPVTIKCRLGADDVDSYEDLLQFVENLSNVGVTHFIVHARKCLLNGFTPTQNRTIPPLRYDWVHRVAREYPHLEFSINGGFKTIEQVLGQRNEPRRKVTGLARGEKENENKKKEESIRTTRRDHQRGESKDGEERGAGEAREGREEERGGENTGRAEKGGQDKGNGTSVTTSVNSSTIDYYQNDDDDQQKNSSVTVVSTPLGDIQEKALLRGVMVGRAAYQSPWILSDVDRLLYDDVNQNLSRREVMHRYIVYGELYLKNEYLIRHSNSTKSTVRALLKPLFWMFKGLQNGSMFRRTLELECNVKPMLTFRGIVEKGMSVMSPTVLDRRPSDGVDLDSRLSRGGKKSK
jgi:tRNA-dihydrouridine synthase